MLSYCSQCLYDSLHPFGFSKTQEVCLGCQTHQEKYEINWNEKHEELKEIVKKSKKKSIVYDCIIPVVGDAEDYYVVSKVLELGLNPLIVSVNDYFKNNIGWYNLHNLITHFDLDSIVFNPDMRIYKDLVRTSLRKFDHILLPFLTLHTSFPVHIAKERKIPLIIWGQHQAIEQVGKFSHHDKVEMSKWSRKEHDLFRTDIDSLIGNGAQVNEQHLNYYRYPKISSLYTQGVHGIYLSNYFRWDPLAQNHSTLQYGFKPQYNSSSFDIYERAGSSVYYQFHDLLKYKRLGYRKIRDHLSREIRHNRITRNKAITLEQQYNSSKIDVDKFFNWLGMSESGKKWFVMHKLNGLEDLIGKNTYNDFAIPKSINKLLVPSKEALQQYIIYGKGVSL